MSRTQESDSPPSAVPQSEAMFARASLVTPGGVNSPVRAFNAVGGTPRFIESARGAWLTDVDGREYVDLIRISGDSLLGVIGNVLDISKIEAGKVVVEAEDFDLVELCDDVAAALGGLRLGSSSLGGAPCCSDEVRLRGLCARRPSGSLLPHPTHDRGKVGRTRSWLQRFVGEAWIERCIEIKGRRDRLRRRLDAGNGTSLPVLAECAGQPGQHRAPPVAALLRLSGIAKGVRGGGGSGFRGA